MAKMNPNPIPKRRITIDIDDDVVRYFQTLAHKEERPYQPLMNKVLRDHVAEQIKAFQTSLDAT